MESFCYKSNHIYVIKVIVILCCLAFVPILYPVQDGKRNFTYILKSL